MDLLSLIGEQPIPILLAVRALEPERAILAHTERTARVAENLTTLIPGARRHPIAGYKLGQAVEQLRALCPPGTVINLTGGTKPMALAAYEAARAGGLAFVYLESERQQSVLYRYAFNANGPTLLSRRVLPGLITIDDYLQAHGLHPQTEQGPRNEQEAGLRRWLEQQVDECRTNLFFGAFEIDFLLRRGNQVALVEAKMGSQPRHARRREGIDQLNTIGGREYLGTYTAKILIVETPLGPPLAELAEARRIRVVVVTGSVDHRTGRLLLNDESEQRLAQVLDEALGPAPS